MHSIMLHSTMFWKMHMDMNAMGRISTGNDTIICITTGEKTRDPAPMQMVKCADFF